MRRLALVQWFARLLRLKTWVDEFDTLIVEEDKA
jgi:hypothetical protein